MKGIDLFGILIGILMGLVLIVVVIGAIAALPVMLLWDWLMPTLFGLKEITWFQAWGLFVLCGLLFKSGSITSKS